jgi:hypothetical protein
LTSEARLSCTCDHWVVRASAVLCMLLTTLCVCCSRAVRVALPSGTWGLLATSPQPPHMASIRLCSPESPGSRKADWIWVIAESCAVSALAVACWVFFCASSSMSRVRTTASTWTPPPVPELVANIAGTVAPPSEDCSTLCRE